MSRWYVRPNTSHNISRTGLSYTNAWGGWSEIIWGSTGVNPGDELIVCGSHSYGAGISVGAHGATAAAPVTIRGDYSPDPGSISFTTSTDTLTMGRAYTILQGFASIVAVSHTGVAVGCKYLYNTFNTPNSTSAIRFGASGDNHSDIEIRGNTFNTVNVSGTNHAALRWWVQTGSNSSFTRATIENNTFNVLANRSVIEFRTQTDSNAAATMSDIRVNYNTFQNYKGIALELVCPGTTAQAGQARGVQIKGNKFLSGTENSLGTLGGAIAVWGWYPSLTSTFGDNIICDNYASNLVGPTGFIDTFYGSYRITDNIGDTFTTSTIDGNGILLDIGTTNTIVARNRLTNCLGKVGTFNSGCGLMILGKCTNNYVFGNKFDTMQTGFFLGDTEGACSNYIYNNVFTGITSAAIQTTSTAALLNNVLFVNNFCAGSGYKVKNNASGVVWKKEQFNQFTGFSTGTLNHTVGNKSKQYSTDAATATYLGVTLKGLDAELLALITGLPNTLLQVA